MTAIQDMIVPSFDDEVETGRKLAIICSKGTLDMAYPGLILGNAALGEGVGNFTLKLDSKQKFFAGLDALTQYVENCKDEDHLTDDVRGKVAAAEEICDQLEAVLASLTKG